MIRKRLLLSAAVIGAGFGFASSAALAQVGDITVTARKVEENLQSTPVAVSAFTGEELQSRGISSLSELGQTVAGLNFQQSFGRRDDRPAIRGSTTIGTPDFGVESGTAIFIDGIYLSADISALGLKDLQRVEVVKGPQSALYGRNAYAGAINFVTQDPSEELEVKAFGSVGEHGTTELYSSLSGHISDGIGVQLFARHFSYDGEYYNPNPTLPRLIGDEETNSFSTVVVLQPTENLKIKLRAAASKDNDGHIPFGMIVANRDYFPGNGVVIGNLQNDDAFDGELPNTDPLLPIAEHTLRVSGMNRDTLLFLGRADWDILGGHTLSFLGGWRSEDRETGSDSNPPPNVPGGAVTFNVLFSGQQDSTEYSFETRLQSAQDQRVRYMIGGFLYQSETTGTDYFSPATLQDVRRTDNWAVFGSIGFDIFETLSVTGELRYAEDQKRITNGQPALAPFNGDFTFDSVSPRVTLDWTPTDSILFYGIVAYGNKPGGFNDSRNRNPATIFTGGQRTPFFDEETAWAYEIGTKTAWLDDRLIVNLAAYYNDIEDAQLTQTYLTSTFLSSSQIVNLEEVKTYGAEALVQVAPTDYLLFTLNYAYTNPEIQGGNVRDNDLLFDNVANNSPTLAGRIFPRISEHEFNAFAKLTLPIANVGADFVAQASYSYESERFVQVDNETIIPSSSLVDARLGIEGDRHSLYFYGKNLTNEDSIVDALRFRDDHGRRAYQTVQRKGSSFGVELAVEF